MKKIYTFIFILIFVGFFSYFFGGEFINYQKNKQNLKINQTKVIKQINDFSLDKVREIKDIIFISSPSKKLLEDIVYRIDNSKKRLYVEVYMLTETKIKDAIKRANDRGIDTKVILEKNPYMAYNINNKTYDFLIKNKVKVVWSNLENYALNHSKFIIADDELILATGNFTHSTFYFNRDIFLFIKDKEIIRLFEQIFDLDFKGIKSTPYNDSLVISPDYSRDKIEKLIIGASENIDMYFPYLDDENIKKLLFDKATKKVKIRLIMDKKSLKNYGNKIKEWEKNNILIKTLKKETEHAKAILVDKKYLYIGSENFSTNSLDKNRETGILLKNNNIIMNYLELFNKDIIK